MKLINDFGHGTVYFTQKELHIVQVVAQQCADSEGGLEPPKADLPIRMLTPD